MEVNDGCGIPKATVWAGSVNVVSGPLKFATGPPTAGSKSGSVCLEGDLVPLVPINWADIPLCRLLLGEMMCSSGTRFHRREDRAPISPCCCSCCWVIFALTSVICSSRLPVIARWRSSASSTCFDTSDAPLKVCDVCDGRGGGCDDCAVEEGCETDCLTCCFFASFSFPASNGCVDFFCM